MAKIKFTPIEKAPTLAIEWSLFSFPLQTQPKQSINSKQAVITVLKPRPNTVLPPSKYIKLDTAAIS